MPAPVATGADPRPALLSVIALMFLLLPCLLLTTSSSRLVGLDLVLAGEGELPADPGGKVEDLSVSLRGQTLILTAQVRRSDVTSGAGDVQARRQELPATAEGLDLVGLQVELRQLKRLDPSRRRAALHPDDAASAQQVVLLMDAMRQDAQGPLFPEVALGGATPEAAP